jgi:hypothetical protein
MALPYLVQKSWTIFPVRRDTRAEYQDLQPGRSGLERPCDAWANAHSVKRRQLEERVVEFDPSGAVDQNVDLLGSPMPMRERLALSGLDDEEVHLGLFGAESSLLLSRRFGHQHVRTIWAGTPAELDQAANPAVSFADAGRVGAMLGPGQYARGAVSASADGWSRCCWSWWRDFTPSLRNALRRW